MLARIVLAIALCAAPVFTTGCASSTAQVSHPNAVDALDSRVYDALVVIKAGLVEARKQFATSVTARPILTAATNAYNVAEAAWQLYHAKKPDAPTAADLTQKLTDAQTAYAGVAGLGKP
jgi:hypothetical protein